MTNVIYDDSAVKSVQSDFEDKKKENPQRLIIW